MPAPARIKGAIGPGMERSLTSVTCSLVVRSEDSLGRAGEAVRPTLTRQSSRCSVYELMFAVGARTAPAWTSAGLVVVPCVISVVGVVVTGVGRDPLRLVLTPVVGSLVVRTQRRELVE